MENEIFGDFIKSQSTYINPYTDFGFKKLFGEEASKDLLIDFLNQLLPSEYQIIDLEFRNSEIQPDIAPLRKAIFDIHCENERKDKFVVEMQKSKLEYFKDRVIWYMSSPIKNQIPKGKVLKIVKKGNEIESKKIEWNYKLKPVYFVGILDFEIGDDKDKDDYIVEVEFKDQNNKVFYDKLKYFFVVMPRFNKKESDLITKKDKWIYFLKNLDTFDEIPAILNEPIFKKGFEIAKIANYNEKQLFEYEQSYNDYLAFNSSMNYQFDKGKMEGKLEIAKQMKFNNLDIELIIQCTGLTKEQINEI